MDRQKALEAALAQIDRAFGKGSAMKLGSKEAIQIEAISTVRWGSTSRLALAACPGRVIEFMARKARARPRWRCM
jgi:recombination protein RecA